MRESRSIMGMPVHLEMLDGTPAVVFEKVFDYLRAVDERFSTYKAESEISRVNRGDVKETEYSPQMQEVLARAEATKTETNGYFDIRKPDGSIDPSGLVKGWAIQNAADLLSSEGVRDFYLEVAGDIQTSGHARGGEAWSIGIRNPFSSDQIVKVIYPNGHGVATSGLYLRGAHIYDPHAPTSDLSEVASLTVIAPNIYDADRMATAAFAMGKQGIHFLEELAGFEAYEIDPHGVARMTSGFESFTIQP